ncbi:MAG: DUF4124 domain-containing protein [Pseudomonadales bacterium]
MDLTKTNLRFSLALPLALFIALNPSEKANAGGKIFKSVDSSGAVTFTDVPLLLGPQVKRGFKGTAKIRETNDSSQSQEAACLPTEPPSKRQCRQKSD